jgi:hypothetical protein
MNVNLAWILEWTIAALLILAVFTTVSWNSFFSYVSRPFLWIRTGVYRVSDAISTFYWWNTDGSDVYERMLSQNEKSLVRSVTGSVRFGQIKVIGLRWDKDHIELIATGVKPQVGDLITTDTDILVGQVSQITGNDFIIRTVYDKSFSVPAVISRTGAVGRLFYQKNQLTFQPVGYEDILPGDYIVVPTSTPLLVAIVSDVSDKQYIKANTVLVDLRTYGLKLWHKTW